MENKLNVKKYWDISLSILITCVVFIPWQLLILVRFPEEARSSMSFYSRHLTEALDGHEGSFFYHFLRMPVMFGTLIPYLIIPSFIIFYKRCSDKKIAIAIIFTIVFVYVFFSLTTTKMPAFTMVLIMPIYICIAFLIDLLVLKIRNSYKNKVLDYSMAAILLIVLALRINFLTLYKYNTFYDDGFDSGYKKAAMHNKEIFTHLKLPENSVLFNVRSRQYIEAMFYSDFPAYNIIPSKQDYADLKKAGRKIVIFKNEEFVVPDYLNKEDIIVLPDTILVFE